MARIVCCGLIETPWEWSPTTISLGQIQGKMIAKHEKWIASAAKSMAQILGLWELFYGPTAAPNSGGPTLARRQPLAKKFSGPDAGHETRRTSHDCPITKSR